MNNRNSITEIVLKPLKNLLGEPDWYTIEASRNENLSAWYETLASYSDNELKRAYSSFKAQNKYKRFPLPAQFKEYCPVREYRPLDNTYQIDPNKQRFFEAERKANWVVMEACKTKEHEAVKRIALKFVSYDIAETYRNYAEQLVQYAILAGNEQQLLAELRSI